MSDNASDYRTVTTNFGDSLQSVALRELQDATRWPEIAWINGLRHPYLTADPAHIGVSTGRVLLFGAPIRIPAPASIKSSINPTDAFGKDVLLVGGELTADASGGVSLARGVANLRQALEMRLRNETRCLEFHPKYGNSAHRLKGFKSQTNTHLLALRFCEETVLADPRVKDVSGGTSEIAGDAIRVTLTALVDDGTTLRLQVEI